MCPGRHGIRSVLCRLVFAGSRFDGGLVAEPDRGTKCPMICWVRCEMPPQHENRDRRGRESRFNFIIFSISSAFADQILCRIDSEIDRRDSLEYVTSHDSR